MSNGAEPAKPCDLVVITCSDFRMWSGVYNIDRAVRERFGASIKYDMLVQPGAIYDLALEEKLNHHAKGLVEDIGMLVDAHGFEAVWIVPHMGCRKYSAFITFQSEAEERQRLADDIRRTAGILRRRFPSLKTIRGSIAETLPTTLLRMADLNDL